MSTQDSSGDRRRASRVEVQTVLRELNSETFVSDLSEGGVFVHTETRPPLGTAIELSFTVVLADPVVIEAHGRVVRHQNDPPGVGIQFEGLTAEMAARIGSVVHPHDSEQPEPQQQQGKKKRQDRLRARHFFGRIVTEPSDRS